MELGSIIGFVVGTFLILLSMFLTADYNIEQLATFANPEAAAVTIGGTLASGIIALKLKTALKAFKSMGIIFKPPVIDPAAAIDQIVQLANTARKEGVLALEESANNMEDEFLKKGVMLIVDGTDPELVKDIMETELSYTEERHKSVYGFFETLAAYAPSWGMIGTLIGLILMLLNMDDPDTMGPMMAVALITTFYGCILANFIFAPTGYKLKSISGEEMLLKTVLIEGMLSIQAGENPRIIEEKLKSFLAPALRNSVGGKGAAAADAGGGDDS